MLGLACVWYMVTWYEEIRKYIGDVIFQIYVIRRIYSCFSTRYVNHFALKVSSVLSEL